MLPVKQFSCGRVESSTPFAVSGTIRTRNMVSFLPSYALMESAITPQDYLVDNMYAFNVIVESTRGYLCAYGGTMSPEPLQFEVGTQLVTVGRRLEEDDGGLSTAPGRASVGIVSGAVLSVLVLAFFMMLKVTSSGKEKST